MSKKFAMKPIALALGATFALGAAAGAHASVFQVSDLGAGYMVAMAGDDKAKEGKCGEGKCGEDKADKKGEGKCGEGKCGEDKAKKADGKDAEGKCGEGKCGEDKE